MAHRIGSLVTVGGDTVADTAALQGDEPGVDAAAGGVDSDGVAAVAGHPELVARLVFALVGHPGHGADPRFNAEPRSNAASKLRRPANGPLRRRRSPRRSGTSRVTTGCDPEELPSTLGISADLSGAAFAGSRSRA